MVTNAMGKTVTILAALIVPACGGASKGPPTCMLRPEIECFHGTEVAAREVLIKFADGTPLASIIDVRAAEEIEYEESIGYGVLHWRSATKDVATLIRDLSTRSDVQYVEANYIGHTV